MGAGTGMKGKRIAIYARFSTDKQSDSSIDDQVHRAREWLRSHGADPDAALVLSDRAASGASMDRPGMRALLHAVESGNVDVIVTESVDRISRDAADAFLFRKSIAYRGISLECLDGTRIASNDKNGLLMFGLRSMLGEQYLIDLADKTRRGLEGRARAGKCTGALPYGFRSVPSASGAHIELDPDRAAVIRRIFGLYASGLSFAGIAEQLNDEGVPAPRAHSRRSAPGWMHSAVRQMLLNERYRGVFTYGEREWVKVPGTNRRIPRERAGGALVRNEQPELIVVDDELWNAVQRRFAQHGKHGSAKAKRRYMLSGLVRCGRCGGVLQVHGGSPTVRYYGCANARKRGSYVCKNRVNIPAPALERFVLDMVCETLATAMDDVQDVVTAEIRAWERSRPDQRTAIRERLHQLETKLANLVEALSTTGSASIAAKVAELEAQRDAQRAALRDLDATAPVLPSPNEITRRVVALTKLTDAHPDQAREVLRRILADERIACEPQPSGTVAIRYDVLPVALLSPESRTPPEAGARGGVSIPLVAGAPYSDCLTDWPGRAWSGCRRPVRGGPQDERGGTRKAPTEPSRGRGRPSPIAPPGAFQSPMAWRLARH